MSAKWPPLRYCLFAFGSNGMLLQIPMQQTAKPWHGDLLQLGNILIPVPWGFFGKAAPGCCPRNAKPRCCCEWWFHIPHLGDLAPGAAVYLAGSLNFGSSSAPRPPALAFVLVSCPHLSRRCRMETHTGSCAQCTTCLPQAWCLAGFWAHRRSGTAWTNM